MPELPDVEGLARYLARYAVGRRVRHVRVRDAGVLRNTTPQGLGHALDGERLGEPRRHGKWLLVPVGRGRLVLHFGMTGALAWSSREPAWEEADRVVLELEGGALSYRSQRKLGGLWWLGPGEDPEAITGPLGPDAAGIERAAFEQRLAGRRGGVKSALMDQALVAGIGNELSDEVLWRARVHPRTAVKELSAERIGALHAALREVLDASMRHGRIPRAAGWLESVRGEEDARCPRCGAALRHGRVAGRTAWWCPREQR